MKEERLLSETDTRAKLIDPKLRESGWKEEMICIGWYGPSKRRCRKKCPFFSLIPQIDTK